MSTEEQEVICQFLRACQSNGYYSFTVNGREVPVESEEAVQEILQLILEAPADVQQFRLNQAKRELPKLMVQNASRIKVPQSC